MTNREIQSSGITLEPAKVNVEMQNSDSNVNLLSDKIVKKTQKSRESFINFVYNSRKNTVLGRDALNWGKFKRNNINNNNNFYIYQNNSFLFILAKLSTFYTMFYFILGCFFVGLTYVFATMLDRTQPRYFNTESTMAVRSTAAVGLYSYLFNCSFVSISFFCQIVGMGFRPQPYTHESLIRITNDSTQRRRIASSLKLFRNVFLLQNSDAKVHECSTEEPASTLPAGTACSFNWHHIVKTDNHPCSDKNLFGFLNEQPCILVKLNKV